MQEPFSEPPAFNERAIEQLIEIVSEKLDEAQDHLWLLQTDPTYFFEHLSYLSEYSLNNVSGCDWTLEMKVHELHARLMLFPVAEVQDWTVLLVEVKHVQDEYLAHKQDITPEKSLPESYDRALGALTSLVNKQLAYKSELLKQLTYVSPAWRSLWLFIPNEGPTGDMKRKDGLMISQQSLYPSDHMLYYVTVLGQTPGSRTYVQPMRTNTHDGRNAQLIMTVQLMLIEDFTQII